MAFPFQGSAGIPVVHMEMCRSRWRRANSLMPGTGLQPHMKHRWHMPSMRTDAHKVPQIKSLHFNWCRYCLFPINEVYALIRNVRRISLQSPQRVCRVYLSPLRAHQTNISTQSTHGASPVRDGPRRKDD